MSTVPFVVAFDVVAFDVVAFDVVAFGVVAFDVVAFGVVAFDVVAFDVAINVGLCGPHRNQHRIYTRCGCLLIINPPPHWQILKVKQRFENRRRIKGWASHCSAVVLRAHPHTTLRMHMQQHPGVPHSCTPLALHLPRSRRTASLQFAVVRKWATCDESQPRSRYPLRAQWAGEY